MVEDALLVLLEITALCLELLCAILNILYLILLEMRFITDSLVSKRYRDITPKCLFTKREITYLF